MADVPNYATLLQRWRMEHNLKLDDSSALTGLSKSYLSRLERGQRQASRSTKVRIARGLGAAIRELFDPQEGAAA